MSRWTRFGVHTTSKRRKGAEFYLGLAEAVALGADCSRRQVGAIVVSNKRVVSTGFNGSPPGKPGCLDDGACPRAQSGVEPGDSYATGAGKCIAIHAEMNALLYASPADRQGATLYLVCLDSEGQYHRDQKPCDGCWTQIEGSGITLVVTPHGSTVV